MPSPACARSARGDLPRLGRFRRHRHGGARVHRAGGARRRIAPSRGVTFGKGGESFLRFNIATPRARVARRWRAAGDLRRPAKERYGPPLIVTMERPLAGTIRIGISGWTYAPWRGRSIPPAAAKRELAYAAGRFASIEIDGTFYGLQRPESFAAWSEQVPSGFVFAIRRRVTSPTSSGSATSRRRAPTSSPPAAPRRSPRPDWIPRPMKFDPARSSRPCRPAPRDRGGAAARPRPRRPDGGSEAGSPSTGGGPCATR